MDTRNRSRVLIVTGGLFAFLIGEASAQAQAAPNEANFANWADLKCYAPNANQDLSTLPPITISQLNPLFQAPNPVIPDHQVQLHNLKQICVPVAKNDRLPPTDSVQFLKYFDLACYSISAPANASLPAMILQHRNPVLVNPNSTPPGTLPPSLQREVVSFQAPPSDLCVPIAKNGATSIPSNVRRVVQYLDFECFDFTAAAQTPNLNANLRLTHMNPLFANQPVENVIVTAPRKLCVPVNKNKAVIPPDVLKVIRKVDLKKYDIMSPTGGPLPPLTQGFVVSQLNPLLVNVPPFDVGSMTPQQVMLPVAKCNPYRVKSQTIIPPDNFFSGPLYYNLQSNCPGSPRACGGSVTLPANTSATSKCNLLVGAINGDATCAANGFVASTPDACASGTFEVVNNLCTATTFPAGSGVALGLSNDDKVLNQENGTTPLPDYELDIITPACGGVDGAGTGVIKGTPTGTPFIPGSNPTVVFAVDLSPVGGSTVMSTVPTVGPGGVLSPSGIVGQGVQQLNAMIFDTGVVCSVVPGKPRAFRCSGPSGESIGSGVQINDTGLTRGSIGGGAAVVDALSSCIDTGSSQCKNFQFANVVAVAASVPATPPWAIAGLTALLLGAGYLFLRRRGVFSRQ